MKIEYPVETTQITFEEWLKAKAHGFKLYLPFTKYESYLYRGCMYLSRRNPKNIQWEYSKTSYCKMWDTQEHHNVFSINKDRV